MAWYKFHAIHGPGHQSESTEYKWFHYSFMENGEPSELELTYLWENWARNWHDSVGGFELVRELPSEIIASLIKQYTSEQSHVAMILNDLFFQKARRIANGNYEETA